jgi:hypothetical protein
VFCELHWNVSFILKDERNETVPELIDWNPAPENAIISPGEAWRDSMNAVKSALRMP